MEMERAGARRSYINASRKKSIRKKKRAYQPAIEKAVYGRDTISKMRNVVDYNTVSTRADNIIPIVSVLQTCPDWGNFSTSFQQYNLLKVSMKIFVGNTTPGTSAGPNALTLGLAYSASANGDKLTSMLDICDFKQFVVTAASNRDSSVPTKFSFSPRPLVKPPYQCTSNTENYGYVKTYSDAYGGNTVFAYKIIYTFTVSFAGEV